MAILESPENGGATATTMTAHENESSDLNLSLRRRPTASLNTTVTDSSSKTSSSEDDYLHGDSSRGEGDAKKGCQEGHDRGDGAVNPERIENHGNRVGSDARFTFRPSVPAHRRIKESPLSSDAIFKQSHAGLFNLCIVVLVAVNSRLIIENLMKVVVLLHVLNTTAAVLYPVLVILRCDSVFMSVVTLMLFACIVWLKLVSYAHTNYDIRALAKSVEKGEMPSSSLNVDYSYDVNIKSLAYFMVAPTLCYQLCIAVPCHIFELWAFFGIMFQVPLVLITSYLQNKLGSSMVGNMFWFFFCILGQPMCASILP